jgi:hypothetical protein
MNYFSYDPCLRWVELTRRNQVKNTSGQNLRTAIIKLQIAIMGFALWFALIMCDPFSRAPHRLLVFRRWDAEEGHGDPS